MTPVSIANFKLFQPHIDKPEGKTILQEVLVAKSIQGKNASCPRVWEESFSEHFDVETELSHLVETEYSNTCSDINVHPSKNNGDYNLSRMVILTSVFNNPEVDNVNSNSGLKAQRRRKQVIDRMRFLNGNKDT